MPDTDGADELVAGAARIGVTAAGVLTERAARSREADTRRAEADDRQAAHELGGRAQAVATTSTATQDIDRNRRRAQSTEAALLVTGADAADRRAGARDPEAVEARRLAVLHQAWPASQAVATPPSPHAERGRSATAGRGPARVRERTTGR